MLDTNLLRKDLDRVVRALARRGLAFDTDRYHALARDCVLSLSVMMAMPTSAPGASPNTRS